MTERAPLNLSCVHDLDLTSDEAWQPMLNPYTGSITPAWEVTQQARFQMGYAINGDGECGAPSKENGNG